MRITAGVAAFATGVALALAAGAGGAPSRASATAVRVKLIEYRVLPAPRSVRAGRVTFVVRNAGKIAHELVVIRTARQAAKLPMKEGEASEKGAVGEISDLEPGQTKRLTLTLKRGHYALICNLPGHYRAGQHADLKVR